MKTRMIEEPVRQTATLARIKASKAIEAIEAIKASKAVMACLVAAAALLLAASVAEAGSAMDRINKSGTLRVGVSGGQPPFNMKAKNGQVIGLEVDLAHALASSMGVKAEFVVIDFAELISSVAAGKVDIALSGLTMTPRRNRRVAFAGPYFLSGKGLLTKSETLARADDLADLSMGQYRFVALDDSTSLQLISQLGAKVKASAVVDHETGIQQVIDGKADAMVADFPACLVALLRHPDAGLESIVSPFTFEPLGAAVRPDDALLVNLVQNYMNTLEGIGLMEALRAKWFDNGDWLALLP